MTGFENCLRDKTDIVLEYAGNRVAVARRAL
jgi:hypothetical protein